jgi:uncharacterized Zn-binding protein involved in type VI secretion
MPGYLLHLGATVLCAHPPGQATPVVTDPRVKVGGQPIAKQTSQYAIAGCALTGSPFPPCSPAEFVTAQARVRAGGVPVLLQDSQSMCVPTGTPLNIVVTQVRVKGT